MDNPVGALNGYELNNLVEHLELSGQADKVLKLLRLEWVTESTGARSTYRNAWFAARSARGDIEGFASDLGRALRMLDRELPLARADRRPGLVAAQIYYALALASLQSRSDALPTALIERLLAAGRPYAVTLARNIPAPGWRAKALALLAPHLPPTERAAVVAELTELITAPEANLEYVAPALRHAAPYLSGEDSRRIRQRLDDVRYQEARASIQGTLAATMTEAELDRTVGEALRYPDSVKEAALAGLAPHLPERALERCVRDVLGWPHRIRHLAALAPWLTANRLRGAVADIRRMDSDNARTRFLAVVVPLLSPADRRELLPAVLRGLDRLPLNKPDTALALVHLLPALTPKQRAHMLRRTLRTLSGYAGSSETPDVLRILAPHLSGSGSLRRKALRITRRAAPRDRVRALAALLAGTPVRRQPTLAREALTASRQLPEPRERAEPLVSVLVNLDAAAREAVLPGWLAEADGPLAALRDVSRTQWEEQWDRLAPHLTDETATALEQRLSAARDANLWVLPLLKLRDPAAGAADDALRTRLASVRPASSPILVALGLHASLAPAERAAVVGEAIAVARSSPQRMTAVPALLPHLDTAERAPVVAAELERVAGFNFADSARATVAVEMAPFLPDDALRDALRRGGELREDSQRARALIGLAGHLPESLAAGAAELVSAIDYPGSRCRLLVALARQRGDPDRVELLDRAVALLDESLRRRYALTHEAATVADLLPDDKRELLLRTCLATMPHWAWISGTLKVQPLMPRWSADQRREALATLRRFAEREEQHRPRDEQAVIGRLLTRADLLDLQETYLPGTLPDATETIRDLAYTLAELRVDPARDILRTSRATALVRLARHLDDEIRADLAERALELLRTERRWATLHGERHSGWSPALAELAAIGDDTFARKLLAEATDIDDDETRTNVLANLVARFAGLAAAERDASWCHLLRTSAARGRASLLADLTTVRTAIAAVTGRDPGRDIEHALAQVVVAWP